MNPDRVEGDAVYGIHVMRRDGHTYQNRIPKVQWIAQSF
jgi:hypothetical protein